MSEVSPSSGAPTRVRRKSNEGPYTLFCVCQQKYDPDGPDMVACDKCSEWYHWECIGIDSVAEHKFVKKAEKGAWSCHKSKDETTPKPLPPKPVKMRTLSASMHSGRFGYKCVAAVSITICVRAEGLTFDELVNAFTDRVLKLRLGLIHSHGFVGIIASSAGSTAKIRRELHQTEMDVDLFNA